MTTWRCCRAGSANRPRSCRPGWRRPGSRRRGSRLSAGDRRLSQAADRPIRHVERLRRAQPPGCRADIRVPVDTAWFAEWIKQGGRSPHMGWRTAFSGGCSGGAFVLRRRSIYTRFDFLVQSFCLKYIAINNCRSMQLFPINIDLYLFTLMIIFMDSICDRCKI